MVKLGLKILGSLISRNLNNNIVTLTLKNEVMQSNESENNTFLTVNNIIYFFPIFWMGWKKYDKQWC